MSVLLTDLIECQCFNKDPPAEKRLLYESPNFVVVPSIGALVEGYLLIISKDCYLNAGALPAELYLEFEEVQQRIREVLTKHYQPPLFFEHGCARYDAESRTKARGGCCVDHFHLHAVPTDVDLYNALLQRGYSPTEIDTLAEIKRYYERNTAYNYVETSAGRRYTFNVDERVTSQFLRRVIAEGLGLNEWNWITNPRQETLEATLRRLNGKIK